MKTCRWLPILLLLVFSCMFLSCDDGGTANNTNNTNNINNVNNLNNTTLPEVCDNQLDDDGDGQTDCDDADCTDDPACVVEGCGDGAVTGLEECDGANLNGKTCADFNFTGGELGCWTDCTFVFGSCTGGSLACETAADALTTEMYGTAGASCSATVRLDYATLEILGFQLFCGGYTGMDEAGARTAAERDTGISTGAVLVNPDDHGDNWVFYEEGGAAALVSGLNGLVVFGGTWGSDAAGDLTWPSTWRDADLLAEACPPSGRIPSTRGFDLSDHAAPLTEADWYAPLAVVKDTALLEGFWQGGYVFDATVLLYPRTLPFDGSSAEWIVILGGGWLE